MLILAVLANVCYSTAYLVDFTMQASTLAAGWRRWRGLLWLAGTLFALLIAMYWIGDEIYPYELDGGGGCWMLEVGRNKRRRRYGVALLSCDSRSISSAARLVCDGQPPQVRGLLVAVVVVA